MDATPPATMASIADVMEFSAMTQTAVHKLGVGEKENLLQRFLLDAMASAQALVDKTKPDTQAASCTEMQHMATSASAATRSETGETQR
tara:strand:- start:1697 stop:1963 length:267 start_codon:yes stop_codon:yes gene_type:complete